MPLLPDMIQQNKGQVHCIPPKLPNRIPAILSVEGAGGEALIPSRLPSPKEKDPLRENEPGTGIPGTMGPGDR